MTGAEYDEVRRADSARGEVLLRRRLEPGGPAVLELRVNGIFVMDTRETASERALATEALGLVSDPRNVLIGGLGLGFTTREVLSDVRVEKVTVVEIEESLIGWMRSGVIETGPALLADARLTVIPGDLRDLVAEVVSTAYDLVLLDVDNGPGHLVHEANGEVYRQPFLRRIRELLSPLGAVVVWSANDAPDLEQAMAEVFGDCTRIACPVQLQDRAEEYLLYLSRARAAGR